MATVPDRMKNSKQAKEVEAALARAAPAVGLTWVHK